MSIYDRHTKSAKTTNTVIPAADDDDWDSSDYVNDLSEQEQRWGMKVNTPKDKDAATIHDLREKVISEHESAPRAYHSSHVHKYGEQ